MKRLLIILCSLCALLTAVIGLLLGTSEGVRLIFKVAQGCLPGFTVERVEGNWRHLTLHRLRYQGPIADIGVETLQLSFGYSHLPWYELRIEQLRLQGFQIVCNEGGTSVKKTTPSRLPKWMKFPTFPSPKIIVARTQLNNFTLHHREVQVAFSTLVSEGGSWSGRQIALYPIQIDNLLVTSLATTNGTTPLPHKIQRWFEQLEDLPRHILPHRESSLSIIPFTVQVHALCGKDWRLHAHQPYTLDLIVLSGELQPTGVKMQRLTVQHSEMQIDLKGSLALENSCPFLVEGHIGSMLAPQQRLQLQCTGTLFGQSNSTTGVSHTPQIKALLKVSHQGEGFTLPLPVQTLSRLLNKLHKVDGLREREWHRLRLHDLKFTFSGNKAEYRIALQTHLQGKGTSINTLVMQGQGNWQQFNLQQLKFPLMEGDVDLTGFIAWNPHWYWKLHMELTGVNGVSHGINWPVALVGSIDVTGTAKGSHWQFAIPNIQIQGTINRQPVLVSGGVQGDSLGQWHVPSMLQIVVGKNRLHMQEGRVLQKTLTATLDAPTLEQLWPGLRGAIHGRWRLQDLGSLSKLTTTIEMRHFRWKGIQIGYLRSQGLLQRHFPLQGEITLHMDHFVHQQVKVDHVALKVAGNEQKHQLQLNVQGELLALQLDLLGHFKRLEGRWHGVMQNALLQTSLGAWKAIDQIDIHYHHARQQWQMGRHQWQGKESRITFLPFLFRQGSGILDVEIVRFNLALLQPIFTPRSPQWIGSLTGRTRLSWRAEQRWPAWQLWLQGDNIKCHHAELQKEHSVELGTLQLQVGWVQDMLRLHGTCKLPHNRSAHVTLHIDDLQNRPSLSGSLQLQQISLLPLQQLLRYDQKIQGLVSGQLRIAGSIAQPLLFGRLVATQVELQFEEGPTDTMGGRVAFNLQGNTSLIDGHLKSSKGEVRLQGKAGWEELSRWHVNLSIKGGRLLINWLPQLQLQVVPDVQIEATPQAIQLGGTLTIPSAQINLDMLSDGIATVSKHEVILNYRGQAISTQTLSIPIQSSISIICGEEVALAAFGLRSKMEGRLKVIHNRQGLGLYGQLNLHQGRFLAYGQNLTVRKGTLLFLGPVRQMMLEVEAIRSPDRTDDNIIAGLRITGLASTPTITVFSEPLLSQTEALSYLVNGHKQGASSRLVVASQIGLSVLQSGKRGGLWKAADLIGRVGQVLGITELTLHRVDNGQEPQFVISGCLWRDMQFKYNVASSTVELRFRLLPRLYLEMVSGVEHACKLLYKFEF